MIKKAISINELENVSGGEDEGIELINPSYTELPSVDLKTPAYVSDDGVAFMNAQDDPNHIKAFVNGLKTCVNVISSFFKGLGDP